MRFEQKKIYEEKNNQKSVGKVKNPKPADATKTKCNEPTWIKGQGDS